METCIVQAPDAGLSAESEPPEYIKMMRATGEPENDEHGIEDDDGEEDTEADENAWPRGSGPRGRGPPLQVGSFEKRREIVDGAGLCSLGKWPPAQRLMRTFERLREIRVMLMKAV